MVERVSVRKITKHFVSVTVVAALVLTSACATVPPGPQIADAPDDNCAINRAAFRVTGSSFDVGEHAALALVAGVGTGVITGLVAGPKAGLVVGAAVAGTGLIATLIQADFQQKQAEERRKALLAQTDLINRFGERVTGAGIALDHLTTCRRGQVQAVRADYRAHRVPRADAEQRLAQIRGWYDDDVKLVSAFDAQLGNDSKQLAESSKYINKGGIETEQVFRPFNGIVALETSARKAPDSGAPTVVTLRPGETLRVAARDGGWLQVSVSGGKTAYVPISQVAYQRSSSSYTGKTAQKLHTAAQDNASDAGAVAPGSPYNVVGAMPGWLVVEQGSAKDFVRADALAPTKIDDSGREVVQAAATAVVSRDAFTSNTAAFEADAQHLSLDS